jgi:hypothetical protein
MNTDKLHTHTGAVILVGSVLIAAHVALLGLASIGRLPLAVVAGVLSVVALKYAWWRLRH